MGHFAALCAVAFCLLPGEDDFRVGKQAESQAQYADAVKAYRACAGRQGPLEHYARLQAAACTNLAGDSKGAIDALTKLIEESSDGAWVPLAEFELGQIYQSSGKHEIAARHFDNAQTSPVKLWWQDDIRWKAAENLLEVPASREDALGFFRAQAQSTPWRDKRYDACVILAASNEVSDALIAATGFLRGRDPDEAAAVLDSIEDRVTVNENQLALWHYAKARLQLLRSKRGEGIAALESLVSSYPKELVARKALSDLISEDLRRKDFASAEASLARLESLDSRSGESISGRNALARAYSREERPEEAIEHYKLIVERVPPGATQRTALNRLAMAYLELGNGSFAQAAFRKIVERYPESDTAVEAAFQSGQLLLKAGAEDAAIQQFRFAVQHGLTRYYGYRAQEVLFQLGDASAESARNLHVDGDQSFLRSLSIDEDLSAHTDSSLVEDQFQRISFFGAEGYPEAEWEAVYLAGSFNADTAFAKQYLAMGHAGVAYTAMQIADANNFGENEDGSQTLDRLRIRYPLAYWDTIQTIAAEVELNPYLVLSVARQESTYRPGLESSAGAVGMMQVMPRTARWIADNNPELSYARNSDLKRPALSMRLGAQYIRQMLDRYDGNLVYALAAYNAGPGNCDKWRKKFPDSDLAEFVESIPFSETQNYVKRVLAHYATYHSLYPNLPPSKQ